MDKRGCYNISPGKEGDENMYITQDTFIDILAQCAFEVASKSFEMESVDKVNLCVKLFQIIMFMERISYSEGPSKILRESGHTKWEKIFKNRLLTGESTDLMILFRQAYPAYFKIEEISSDKQRKKDFFDVLNGEL